MKNIVWLASYPKSGNTWFRMFISNLLINSKTPLEISHIRNDGIASSTNFFENETGINPFELTNDEIDLIRPSLYKILSNNFLNANGKNEFMYLKVHDAFTFNQKNRPIFPSEVSKCAIYFVRNPHDVCISYANHSACDPSRILDSLINKKKTTNGLKSLQLHQQFLSWGLHYRSWANQREIPVKVIRYEDMLSDPYKVFTEAVKFIGLDYDQERIKRAVDNSSFDKLKKMEQKEGFAEKVAKTESFFWKGEAGYYKNYLTKEQIDIITDNFRDEMEELGYIKDNKLTF